MKKDETRKKVAVWDNKDLFIGDKIEYIGGYYDMDLRRGKILKASISAGSLLVIESSEILSSQYVREVRLSNIIRIVPPTDWLKVALWVLMFVIAIGSYYLLTNQI